METKELIDKAVKQSEKHDRSVENIIKTIEDQASKLPSDTFLLAGLGCLAFSAFVRIVGLRSAGQFVGQLAVPILIAGLYGRLARIQNKERE